MTTQPAPAAPTAATRKTARTIYVVLRKNGSSWQEDGPHQTAASAAQAVRQAAEVRRESDVDPDGEYIAIPLRSFVAVKVKTETKTTIKLT